MCDLDIYLDDDKFNGSDSYSSKFWMGVHGLKTQQEFIDLIGEDKLKQWSIKNNEFENIKSKYCHKFNFNMNFLSNPPKDSHKLLKYFDNFEDKSACKRIVKYLEDNLGIY